MAPLWDLEQGILGSSAWVRVRRVVRRERVMKRMLLGLWVDGEVFGI